jgi:uncharacterized membrane protein YvlD (DUF360 family)
MRSDHDRAQNCPAGQAQPRYTPRKGGKMRFILTAVFGVIAYALYPVGVFSIPFSQLTLGNILCVIGAAFFGLLAAKSLIQP